MLIPTGGTSHNPHQIVPPWIGLLRDAARVRQLEQEPPPAPLEWPSLGLAETDDPKERASLAHYAMTWLSSVGRDAARYLSEGLSGCAAGFHSTSGLENTLEAPTFRVKVTRRLSGDLGKGAPILDYSIQPKPSRHGAWPVVCASVRSGRLECGDLPLPAEGVNALHLVSAHDIAADLVRHLTR